MRAPTWRIPCQSWERAPCSSQTEGFSPSVAVNASLKTGLVLSGPDCLVVGVIFSLLVCQCLCLHTQLLGGSACLNKHMFMRVYVLDVQISLAPYMFLRAHVSAYFGFLLMSPISPHVSMYPGSGCEPMRCLSHSTDRNEHVCVYCAGGFLPIFQSAPLKGVCRDALLLRGISAVPGRFPHSFGSLSW